jgi:hypothetical protein
MTHKLPEFPSPLAGVCNGQVWNAPSIPQKMLGASSTCPLQTDTKPWSRSGLGGVGAGDWSIGRASRWAIALRPVHFLSRKGAKAQRSASPTGHPELVSPAVTDVPGSYLVSDPKLS